MQEERSLPTQPQVRITVSDDKLHAFLHIDHADDASVCTLDQLLSLLQEQRVVYGIDYAKLQEISRNPSQFLHAPTVVATGDRATDGIDGKVESVINLNADQRKPLELEDGRVDFKEVISLNNVRKGQLIARIIPPTEGTPGKTVTGEVLMAKPGKEARFHAGKNIVFDPEQQAYYAAIDGMVTKTDKDKINVFPIYEVNGDVDFSIGNIDFVGSVVIRGTVRSGFRIRAEGDVRVTGAIEAAEIEAGGSIHIGAGILGHNKGLVRAGKTVKSSFIQDANVEAGEDIVVSQSIMHSSVRAGRDVICQGLKGLIVGGVIQAGEKVIARTIGNTMSTATTIEVGVRPELRNELQELRSRLKSITEHVDKTDKALTLLNHLASIGKLSDDKAAMRVKLNHTKKQAVDEMELIKERILEIERTLEDAGNAKIVATSTVYAGTKMIIGRYTKYIKDTVAHVQFYISEGDISMAPHV